MPHCQGQASRHEGSQTFPRSRLVGPIRQFEMPRNMTREISGAENTMIFYSGNNNEIQRFTDHQSRRPLSRDQVVGGRNHIVHRHHFPKNPAPFLVSAPIPRRADRAPVRNLQW